MTTNRCLPSMFNSNTFSSACLSNNHEMQPFVSCLFVCLFQMSMKSRPNILLSNTVVAENSKVNTVVGTLSTIDPDKKDSFT